MKLFILFIFIAYVAGQESCTSEKTPKGECRGPQECPPLYHLVTTFQTGELLLHVGNCSVDRQGNQKICCPLNYEEKCVVSPGEGTCRRLTECPEVERLFRDLPFNQFKQLYSGCLDDNEGNKRWCCPIPAEKCTTSRSGLRGECQELLNCPILNALSDALSGSFIISNFGAGCNKERAQDTRICCPTDPLNIATSAVPDCESPSQVIPDLGCIVPVADLKTWDDAMTKCNTLGGRLLEGFRGEHFHLLKQHFHYYFRPFGWLNAHVGIKNSTWVTSRAHVEDDMWLVGEPDGTTGEECGLLFLYGPLYSRSSSGYLIDSSCSSLNPSLCQLLH